MEVCAQAVADRAAGVSVAAGRAPAPGRWALALALAASVLVALRVDLPPYFDNEGRYAEVAREMVVLGDYATPHLDFALFLNKPPLLYWLTALVFHVIGPSEWARLVSVAAGAVTLLATCRLGALLYGEPAGLVAGLALATSAGFVLEARTLRPDMLLTAAVVVALWCWRRAIAADRRRGRWLAAMYVALGAGVLTKGLVPLVVFGIPVALVTLRDEGWRGFGRLRPGLGVAVLAAIVLPWHVLAAFRHPGFAWDYIVNQHLLFFLDRKLPRDSSGDPLGFFWAAYAARAIPWVLLVPLTLAEAVRGARRKAPGAPRATALVWAWAGGLLLFFSCAPSRLEHYGMPALPAAALLAARVWQRAGTAELGPPAWRLLAAAGAVVVVAGAAGLVVGRRLLGEIYWIAEAPELSRLVSSAGVLLVAAGVGVALVAARRHASALVAVLAASGVGAAAIVLRAEVAVGPLFSWQPLAAALAATPPETDVVFEAPEEYQIVGGLAYYTRRRITLLEPPGFVPPTYLAGHTGEMFVSRAELARRWGSGRPVALVSDPQRRRDEPLGLAPGTFHVLARFGDRWVVTNFPVRAVP
ncbi:MAG: phospholipid carrier-dependent glycosyltransferase [Deltaproteobacteria bacterium]|nr:MAG: phospholipid carrier-dependent glycosyltransferase [Deltaproteobacteria bacterium]